MARNISTLPPIMKTIIGYLITSNQIPSTPVQAMPLKGICEIIRKNIKNLSGEEYTYYTISTCIPKYKHLTKELFKKTDEGKFYYFDRSQDNIDRLKNLLQSPPEQQIVQSVSTTTSRKRGRPRKLLIPKPQQSNFDMSITPATMPDANTVVANKTTHNGNLYSDIQRKYGTVYGGKISTVQFSFNENDHVTAVILSGDNGVIEINHKQ